MMASISRRLGQFAAVSLLGMIVMVLVVALYVRSVAVQELKAVGISQHETLARTLLATLDHHIAPAVDALPNSAPGELRRHEVIRDLRAFLVDPLVGMKVVRIKIYDATGRVVFSTEESQIGDVEPDNESFLAAMAGQVVGEMIHRDTFNVSDGVIEDRDLLETYVPIRDAGSGTARGVFEMYSDMTDLVRRSEQTQRRVVLGPLLISGLTFAVLFLLFRRTETGLRREEQAAASYLTELKDARENLAQKVEERTRELAGSRQRFKDVIDASGEYIWEVDHGGHFTFISERASEVLGYAPDELIGRTPMELAPEEDVVRVRGFFANRPDGAAFTRLEHRSFTARGDTVWLSVSGVPMHDEQGTFSGYRGAARDITARKEDEQRIRQMSLAIEQSSEVVVITDPSGQIEYVNPAFTAMSGFDAEEVMGQTPRLLRSGVQDDAVYADLWRTIKTGQTWHGELCNRRKDGRLLWNLVAIFPLREEEGTITHFVGLQTDITERKRSDEALLASEARLRAVMDSVTDAIIAADANGTIEMVNPATEKLFGYDAGELEGAQLHSLMPEPFRSEHHGYMARYLRTGEGRIIGVGGREILGLRKDGTTVPLELGVGEMAVPGERKFVGVLRDLSDRKRAERELERTRQQYFHREKIAAMGQLAAGIVHEVGNPAAAISGAVSALRQYRDVNRDPNALRELTEGNLELISEQADRLAAMTREISDFARPRSVEKRLLDLNEVVRSACSLMRFDARVQNVSLQLELDPQLPAIDASADQLTQVVLNLVLNSADACRGMPPGRGAITVRSGADARQVQLTIADNGEGMDDKVRSSAFDPYFTTKGEDQGLGLGLSLCRDIVSDHGGELVIESTPGQGTTVTVSLPCSTALALEAS